MDCREIGGSERPSSRVVISFVVPTPAALSLSTSAAGSSPWTPMGERPEAGIEMLHTIVLLICGVWVIEVTAGLLMYSWALCKRRSRQAGLTHAQESLRASLAR